MKFRPFQMERWQSTYEHRVDFNLSESGVHPMTVKELLALSDADVDLGAVRLGYGQSNGSDELRARIAALYPGATDRNVTVTIGGAEANFIAGWELAEMGAPGAVMLPNYMQVPGLVENLDGGVIPFHLREEHGWRVDMQGLADALEAGAGFILVTNPNNPTGIALRPDEMDEIVALADRHGAWILADEVYQGAEVADETTPSFWGRYDKVMVTNSLSKAYGIPGVRLGWVVAPEEVVPRLWARTDYTTIAPASLSDTLATVAVGQPVREKILQRTRGIIRNNLPILTEWMDRHDGLFSYVPPDAGAICMVRYNAPIDSMTFAERLRVEHSLLIVPGAHFGIESTMRLGFGPPADELQRALDQLGSAFAAVRAA